MARPCWAFELSGRKCFLRLRGPRLGIVRRHNESRRRCVVSASGFVELAPFSRWIEQAVRSRSDQAGQMTVECSHFVLQAASTSLWLARGSESTGRTPMRVSRSLNKFPLRQRQGATTDSLRELCPSLTRRVTGQSRSQRAAGRRASVVRENGSRDPSPRSPRWRGGATRERTASEHGEVFASGGHA
jgi:hypothetical protein